MTPDITENLLAMPEEEVRRELDLLRRRSREISVRISILKNVLELKRGIDQSSEPSPTEALEGQSPLDPSLALTTRDFVLALLRDRPPGTVWRAGEIIAAARASGWLQDRKPGAVLAALTRLVDEGRVLRPSKGKYVLPE